MNQQVEVTHECIGCEHRIMHFSSREVDIFVGQLDGCLVNGHRNSWSSHLCERNVCVKGPDENMIRVPLCLMTLAVTAHQKRNPNFQASPSRIQTTASWATAVL